MHRANLGLARLDRIPTSFYSPPGQNRNIVLVVCLLCLILFLFYSVRVKPYIQSNPKQPIEKWIRGLNCTSFYRPLGGVCSGPWFDDVNNDVQISPETPYNVVDSGSAVLTGLLDEQHCYLSFEIKVQQNSVGLTCLVGSVWLVICKYLQVGTSVKMKVSPV